MKGQDQCLAGAGVQWLLAVVVVISAKAERFGQQIPVSLVRVWPSRQ